jgi:ribosome maturation factor RimP
MRVLPEIESELEGRVRDLGYELVEVVWGGSGQRPLLKLRIDRPDSEPGSGVTSGVTVDDCATVSRGLEPWLDAHEALSQRYVLEVSSPGVDRPLVRQQDFVRFRGERVAVTGRGVLLGRSKRLEGELVGLQAEGSGSEAVLLRMADGEEVDVPRSDIRRVNLMFEWK